MSEDLMWKKMKQSMPSCSVEWSFPVIGSCILWKAMVNWWWPRHKPNCGRMTQPKNDDYEFMMETMHLCYPLSRDRCSVLEWGLHMWAIIRILCGNGPCCSAHLWNFKILLRALFREMLKSLFSSPIPNTGKFPNEWGNHSGKERVGYYKTICF